MSMIINRFFSQQVLEGAGFLVDRVFGYNHTANFDPFLMLDYFNKDITPGEKFESPGVPWHPHKGIETISYILKGGVEHEDSIGNKGIVSAGEIQWMRAGRGILHQEMPGPSPNGVQGFQFWVNLPAENKLDRPAYQYIRNGEMKKYIYEGCEVKVISGLYKDVKGPINKDDLGITMLHVTLKKGASFEVKRDGDKQGFLFVFDGEGNLGSDKIIESSAYTLSPGIEKITATSSNFQCIFAQGIPIKEPIAWNGPIVMNTQQELTDTFKDLENGTFIKEDRNGN